MNALYDVVVYLDDSPIVDKCADLFHDLSRHAWRCGMRAVVQPDGKAYVLVEREDDGTI